MSTSAFHHHNHAHCVREALARAEQLCHDQGVRLTPIRRRVLELVWASHQPLGAYELLDALTAEGHKPAPPTVYRALEFLQEQHLVHRVASRNAFIGCRHPGQHHAGFFLICSQCGNAEELVDVAHLAQELTRLTAAQRFQVSNTMLEIIGFCQHCQHVNKD